ncbi:Conserved_hypothetical protein [Hexamita inflata]|uniref:Transmembrane protein n=1 Tax=Hexamita inflata TaxID=28002 RepID=A0ABP1HRE4_9EUKA
MSLLVFVQMLQPDILSQQIELSGCYSIETESVLFPQNKSLCFHLKSLQNADCAVFPAAVKITATLNAFDALALPYAPYSFMYSFDYSATNFVCVNCADPVCQTNNYQRSSKVQLRIESHAHFTQISCGKVSRVEENRTQCFNSDTSSFPSKLIFYSNRVCYQAALNDGCPSLSSGLTQVNATLVINYKTTVQKMVYLPTNSSTQFQFVNVVGQKGILEYCFGGTNINTISKEYAVNASIDIFAEKNAVLIEMQGSTGNANIIDNVDGFSGIDAYINTDNVQIIGQISNADANTLNTAINGANNKFYSYLRISSLARNTVLYFQNYDPFSFKNNEPYYFTSAANADMIAQIKSLVDKETITNVVIQWNIFVTDANGYIYGYKKHINNIYVPCWNTVALTWKTNSSISVQITPRSNNANCACINPVNVTFVLKYQTGTVSLPSFNQQIINYTIKTETIDLESAQDWKAQIDSAQVVRLQMYSQANQLMENKIIQQFSQIVQNQNAFQVYLLIGLICGTIVYASLYYVIKECFKRSKNQQSLQNKLSKQKITLKAINLEDE